MGKGFDLHNLIQLSIPLWIVPLVLLIPFPEATTPVFPSWYIDPILEIFPGTNLFAMQIFWMLLISFGATFLPDLDHLAMWRKFKHRGFWSFIKIIANRDDRHREAFLICHNYVAMFILLLITIAMFYTKYYWFVFFLTFFVHIFLDYIADLIAIRQHHHWWVRNWDGKKK